MSRQRSMEVIEQAEYVTIGELARLTAVRYSTLKFYTEEGMLPFEQAEENLTRRYRRVESLERIAQIRQSFKHTVLTDCAKTQKRFELFNYIVNIRRKMNIQRKNANKHSKSS